MPQAKAFESKKNYKENSETANPGFNGAAIIDEHGNEVPITEEMIQAACNELKNAWLFPRQTSH